METKTFQLACREAQKLAGFLDEPQLRTAAFHVALDKLLSMPSVEAKERPAPREKGTGHEAKNGAKPKSLTQRRILELRDDGYFQQPRLSTEVQAELRTRGFHHNLNDVQMALLRLAQKREFRRLNEGDKKYRYAPV